VRVGHRVKVSGVIAQRLPSGRPRHGARDWTMRARGSWSRQRSPRTSASMYGQIWQSDHGRRRVSGGVFRRTARRERRPSLSFHVGDEGKPKSQEPLGPWLGSDCPNIVPKNAVELEWIRTPDPLHAMHACFVGGCLAGSGLCRSRRYDRLR
jgi:hypothetical protein